MVIDDKWRLLQLKLSQKTFRKTAVCSYPNSFGCKTNQVAKKAHSGDTSSKTLSFKQKLVLSHWL